MKLLILCLRSLAGFRLHLLGSFFFPWLVGVRLSQGYLKLFVFDSSSCWDCCPFLVLPGGALGIYFFVHLFSRHSLNFSFFFVKQLLCLNGSLLVRLFFVPLAASERLKKRVIGWKFLPGTRPVASVPGYSLRSLSLDHASPPIAFHLHFFLYCPLPVCLLKGIWQYFFLLFHCKELLKLYVNLLYLFCVTILFLEIF